MSLFGYRSIFFIGHYNVQAFGAWTKKITRRRERLFLLFRLLLISAASTGTNRQPCETLTSWRQAALWHSLLLRHFDTLVLCATSTQTCTPTAPWAVGSVAPPPSPCARPQPLIKSHWEEAMPFHFAERMSRREARGGKIGTIGS